MNPAGKDILAHWVHHFDFSDDLLPKLCTACCYHVSELSSPLLVRQTKKVDFDNTFQVFFLFCCAIHKVVLLVFFVFFCFANLGYIIIFNEDNAIMLTMPIIIYSPSGLIYVIGAIHH